jgi:hypothetical protein
MSSLPHEIQPSSVQGLQLLQKAGLIKSGVNQKESHATGLLVPTDQENSDPRESWLSVAKFDSDGNVVSLDFGSCRLRKGLSVDLSQFTHLKILNLGGADLPLNDTMDVLQSLTQMLQCLYLGGNYLCDAGGEKIGLWFPSAAKMRKLDMRYTEMGGAGCRALCNGLAQQGKTTHLYLEGNNLGDPGAQALAEFLQQDGCPLQELFLGANKIGPDGAAAIASALATNKTITKIYLEGNHIGPVGADAFTKVLEECNGNTALKHLFVDNNQIGKEGSKRLAAVLNSSTAIGDSGLE